MTVSGALRLYDLTFASFAGLAPDDWTSERGNDLTAALGDLDSVVVSLQLGHELPGIALARKRSTRRVRHLLVYQGGRA